MFKNVLLFIATRLLYPVQPSESIQKHPKCGFLSYF
jgi:hypothetical protein